jgi:hypothetical protein
VYTFGKIGTAILNPLPIFGALDPIPTAIRAVKGGESVVHLRGFDLGCFANWTIHDLILTLSSIAASSGHVAPVEPYFGDSAVTCHRFGPGRHNAALL